MISRDVLDDIAPWLDRDKIIILKGARQVGKTTILNELQKRLTLSGIKTQYIAADLEYAEPSFGNPRLFLARLADLFGDFGGTVIIDEFQIIPNAGLFLKAIYDQTKTRYRFIVSGSSSLELTKNAEYLTGRKLEFIIRPFSFREYVRVKAADIPDRMLDTNDEPTITDFIALYNSRLKALFAEYCRFGAFPEIVLASPDTRMILLKELFSTYIRKDVAGFQRVHNIAGFNNLVRILAAQIGSQMNRNELASTLRLNIETVNRYLDILQGTYVFNIVPPWFTNARKEVAKMPKVYMMDPGYGLAAGALSSSAIPYDMIDGHLVENVIHSSLIGHFGVDSVKYWRTPAGAEIDFIVERGDGLLPIEVKFTGAEPKSTVAMRHFRDQYKQALPGIMISRDHFTVAGRGDTETPLIIPAYLTDFFKWDERPSS